jgi:hypothetical protein
MKNMRYITICAGILLALACSKDKLETRPSIKIKSVSADVIPNGGTLYVNLEFADKEGDVNDTLYIIKKRLNKREVATLRDSISRKVPDFPSKSRGTIELSLEYSNFLISAQSPPIVSQGPPVTYEPDSIKISFYLKDKANHISDTVAIDRVIVIR